MLADKVDCSVEFTSLSGVFRSQPTWILLKRVQVNARGRSLNLVRVNS